MEKLNWIQTFLEWLKNLITKTPITALVMALMLAATVAFFVAKRIYNDAGQRERAKDEVISNLEKKLFNCDCDKMALIKRQDYKDSVYYNFIKNVYTENGKK